MQTMIAVILTAVFLLTGWIALIIPISQSDTIQLILSAAIGLTAVVITGFTIVITKINRLPNNKDKDKDNK